jgi:hypothetical protein
MVTEQQIEGPGRDDKITQDLGLATRLSAAYLLNAFFEAGLLCQVDAGRVRRALYGRPDASGAAPVEQLVEGSWWELWLVVLVRGRYGPVFAEVGWAPLILRSDEVRADLPNVAGETEGLLVGSRSVAWMLAAGAFVPLTERLDLSLSLQFRIRYLVARGGRPLANAEESGQMTLWPFLGLSYRL